MRRLFSADVFIPCCALDGLKTVLRTSKPSKGGKVDDEVALPPMVIPSAETADQLVDADDVADALDAGDANIVPPWSMQDVYRGDAKQGCPGSGDWSFLASLRSKAGSKPASLLKPISEADLLTSMDQVSSEIRPWIEGGTFALVRTLQQAEMNYGRVDLMTRPNGQTVAVKRMPSKWVGSGPREFAKLYPQASERPWCDLGFVQCLNDLRFPYTCDLLGVMQSQKDTYVITSLAQRGDLFSWCFHAPGRGRERETWMRPMFRQVFTAVRWLHELGIGHRDLSLENMLLADVPGGGLRVQIIDFGMSTLARRCRAAVRGKRSYQAPEMHKDAPYDPFIVDAFSLGVTAFIMAAQDYPWTATRPDKCELYDYVHRFGLHSLMRLRKLRKGDGLLLIEAFSPAFVEMLEGLLEPEPDCRLTIGESCFNAKYHSSVWDCAWMRGSGEGEAEANSEANSEGQSAGRGPNGECGRNNSNNRRRRRPMQRRGLS